VVFANWEPNYSKLTADRTATSVHNTNDLIRHTTSPPHGEFSPDPDGAGDTPDMGSPTTSPYNGAYSPVYGGTASAHPGSFDFNDEDSYAAYMQEDDEARDAGLF